MTTKLPDLGQYLSVYVPEGTYQGTYDSRLQEIKENALCLDPLMNIRTKTIKTPPVGTRMTVSYIDLDDGVPNAFETWVEALRPNQIVIQSPQTIHRQQRREFVRVPITLPVQIMTVDMETQAIKSIRGMTENLSGGGMLVLIDQRDSVKAGDFVGLDFELNLENQACPITAKGQVIQAAPSYRHEDKKACRIKFVNLKEQDRQNIIKFVFRRQIELRDLQP